LFVVFAGIKQPKQVGKMSEIWKKFNLEIMTKIFFENFGKIYIFWSLESRPRDFWWSLGFKVLTRSRSRRLPFWLHHCLHHKENAPWTQALHSHLFWIFFRMELYTSLLQWCTFRHLLQLFLNWRRNVFINVSLSRCISNCLAASPAIDVWGQQSHEEKCIRIVT